MDLSKNPMLHNKVAKTPKPCSCIFCRNKRSYQGETLQEQRNSLKNELGI